MGSNSYTAEQALDPRIGSLNGGIYYAFLHGHGKPEFRGTREEVEIALGIRQPQPPQPAKNESDYAGRWDVRLSYQYPAWDEVDGIWYRNISARNKAEAIAEVRKRASGDGHLGGGKGRVSFKCFDPER